jgi:hypothetical protein
MAVKISVSVKQNSQSIESNTSNVTVKVNYSWTYGSFNRNSTTKYVKINGTKYNFDSADINTDETTSGSGTLYTKTLDISHNADGTGKVEVYAYVDTGTNSGVLTAETTKTLTTIARVSTVTATAAKIGSSTTITISRKSSSFTHTLKYSFKGLTDTIVSKTSVTSYKWTIPKTFYNELTATETGAECKLYCETYSGSTLVGTKAVYFKVSINEDDCHPTLTPTIEDVNSKTLELTGDKNTFIKYYSKAAITFGVEAKYGATIASKIVTNGGKALTNDGSISEITERTFDFTVTDSRGISVKRTISVDMVNYIKLTCNQKLTILVDGTGTLTISGNWFNGNFGAKSNSLSVQYRYKESGGEFGNWNTATATKLNTTYKAAVNLSGLDYLKSYVFESRVVDSLKEVVSTPKTVKALPVFDWGIGDFNHNTDTSIANGKAFQSFTTDGDKKNLIYLTASNNLQIGGGSYPPKAVYLRAAGSGDVRVSNENSDYYSLLGAAKALSDTYSLDTSVELGSNYSSGTATADLIGSNLRVGISATRNAATNIGNITNEEVMVITVNHGGKLKNLYRVDFNNGTEGGVVTLDAQASKKDDNNVIITVRLCATTIATTAFNSYFAMPAGLNLDAYV